MERLLRDFHQSSPALAASSVSITLPYSRLSEMAPDAENSKRIEEAKQLANNDAAGAEAIYKDVLSKGPGTGEAALREFETALMGLGELYRNAKKVNELAELVRTSRSTLSSFAKAKTAKLGMCP